MKFSTSDRPFAIRTSTYVCVCILSTVPMVLLGQDAAKPATTQAQVTNVSVGDVSIAMPSPKSGLVEPGSDYRVIFEPLVPANNRLVAAFLPREEMDAVRAGNKPHLEEYALVEVARRMELTEIDSTTFQQIAEALGRQFGGDTSQSSKDGQEGVNQNLKAQGYSDSVKIEKPVQLGIFFAKTNAIGVGSITPYNVNGVTTRMAGCMTLLRVRGRILSVFTYAAYKDEGTVTWVKTTSEQWADAILKANEGTNGLGQ